MFKVKTGYILNCNSSRQLHDNTNLKQFNKGLPTNNFYYT